MPLSDQANQVVEEASVPGFNAVKLSGNSVSDVVFFGIASNSEYRVQDSADKTVNLVRFTTSNHSTAAAARGAIAKQGWQIVDKGLSLDGIEDKSTVIVLDEMFSPVLADLQDEQFDALRGLLERECKILWVTRGYVFLPEKEKKSCVALFNLC